MCDQLLIRKLMDVCMNSTTITNTCDKVMSTEIKTIENSYDWIHLNQLFGLTTNIRVRILLEKLEPGNIYTLRKMFLCMWNLNDNISDQNVLPVIDVLMEIITKENIKNTLGVLCAFALDDQIIEKFITSCICTLRRRTYLYSEGHKNYLQSIKRNVFLLMTAFNCIENILTTLGHKLS